MNSQTHEYVTFSSMNCGVFMEIDCILLFVFAHMCYLVLTTEQIQPSQVIIAGPSREGVLCCVDWIVFVLCV